MQRLFSKTPAGILWGLSRLSGPLGATGCIFCLSLILHTISPGLFVDVFGSLQLTVTLRWEVELHLYSTAHTALGLLGLLTDELPEISEGRLYGGSTDSLK